MLKANIFRSQQKPVQAQRWAENLWLFPFGLTLALGLILIVTSTHSLTKNTINQEPNLFQMIRLTPNEAQLMTSEFNIAGGSHLNSLDLEYIFSRIGHLATHNPQILNNWQSFQVAVKENATREATPYTGLALNDILLEKAYWVIRQRTKQHVLTEYQKHKLKFELEYR